VKEGTFERGAQCGNPSERPQLFTADRRTSHGSKKKNPQAPDGSARGNKKKRMLPHRLTLDRELEAPTVANHALGLMLILGVAVAQKNRCHLVGYLRMPELGEAY